MILKNSTLEDPEEFFRSSVINFIRSIKKKQARQSQIGLDKSDRVRIPLNQEFDAREDPHQPRSPIEHGTNPKLGATQKAQSTYII